MIVTARRWRSWPVKGRVDRTPRIRRSPWAPVHQRQPRSVFSTRLTTTVGISFRS